MADRQRTRVERYRPSIQFDDDYRNWEYEYKRIIVYYIALLYTSLVGLFCQRIVEAIKCRKGEINLIFLLIPELTCHMSINRYKQMCMYCVCIAFPSKEVQLKDLIWPTRKVADV
jgi:hypothetical protein